MEKSNLRQIQRELLSLLRDTPSSDIRDFFNNNVEDMHEDWKIEIKTIINIRVIILSNKC